MQGRLGSYERVQMVHSMAADWNYTFLEKSYGSVQKQIHNVKLTVPFLWSLKMKKNTNPIKTYLKHGVTFKGTESPKAFRYKGN